jgi:hypothetical protein
VPKDAPDRASFFLHEARSLHVAGQQQQSKTMKHVNNPEHVAVRAWLEDAANRLNDFGLEKLQAHLVAECAAEVKRFKDCQTKLRLGAANDYSQQREGRALSQQHLQVIKPALRWVRSYRAQLRQSGKILLPIALGVFVLSKALQEAPQALWKPLNRDDAWAAHRTAAAVTAYQRDVARGLIAANPALFSPLPDLQTRLPDEHELWAKTKRREVVEARTRIIDKVRDANILDSEELRVLYAMI